jgi:hypothetical protein
LNCEGESNIELVYLQVSYTISQFHRCKNTSIVGVKEVVSQKKSKASSHGSSGIGSDELAPSPELHREDLSNGSSGKIINLFI